MAFARELENALRVKTLVEGVPNVLSITCNSHLIMPGRDLDVKKDEEVGDNVC